MLNKHLIAVTNPVASAENMVFWRDYRITVLTDRLFRVEKSMQQHIERQMEQPLKTQHIFCDQATQSVWYRNLPKVEFQTDVSETTVQVVTKHVTIVTAENLDDSYVIWNGKKIPLNNDGNLLGTYRTLDECDGDLSAPHNRTIQLGTGVVSKSGVAVLDDSASLILVEDGTLQRRNREEKDLYVFAYGHDYREALKAFYQITGCTPLIPRFALGNWWSRYHAYTEKEYIHLMDSFAERNLPFTVATVDMDWHWSETLDEVKHITADGKNDEKHGGVNGWTGYSWNTELFPDYRRFLQKLYERGLRVTMNLHPASGVRYFEDMYEEMAVEMGVDPATEKQIPFDIAAPQFVNAYFKILHKPYEHDGVDFWWIDWQQGSESSLEGLDPLWALNHYHYLDSGLEHGPLILSRYCGAGAHRYPLGFSGDTHVTWKTLKYLPYFTATASNIGYTWWSHDIGGHMYGVKEDELYVRFLQFGVFSPINRLHSANRSTFTKEPWAYMNGSGLIAEEFLRLRHRLIPYLYSASYETTEKGLALIEPLYYEYPEEQEAYAYRNQYFFGGQLLVAPITDRSISEGMACVKAWLPDGKWTDIFTGDEYQGGRELTMVRWLDSIPVLAKEGGILVLDGRRDTNSADNPDYLEVRVYNGNGNYTLYEDWEGVRAETIFTSDAPKPGIQKLTFSCQTASAVPARTYHILFPNILEGKVTVLTDGRESAVSADDNGCVSVVLEEVSGLAKVEIIVAYEDWEEKKREERICRSLTRMEMENDLKEELFKKLCRAGASSYRQLIEKSPLSAAAKQRMLEVM